ncbi:MAG: hypothetical protein IPI53_12265 [Saprospiraceae bacterium]|nr:hypothetical protein [Saprospiraceae bacterium]
MKTKMIVLFIICFALGNDAYGQIQRRPAPKKTEKQKIQDETLLLNDYNFDIKLGNVGFFRNLFLSSKINGGYKFNMRVLKYFPNFTVSWNIITPLLTTLIRPIQVQRSTTQPLAVVICLVATNGNSE